MAPSKHRYAISAEVVYRFTNYRDRDAWVAAAPRGEQRRALPSNELSPSRKWSRRAQNAGLIIDVPEGFAEAGKGQ